MSVSGLPFDDIRDILSNLPMGDDTALQLVRERNGEMAKVFGAAGTHWMEWLAKWSGKSPAITRPLIALFAGNHKVGEYVMNVTNMETIELVSHLAAGGAPVNQVCASNDIGLKVFDLALQFPVEDISSQEALDEKGSAATIGFGMEAIAGGVDILGLSAFGKGSEIANLVLLSLLYEIDPNTIKLDTSSKVNKQILDHANKASKLHSAAKNEPLELLRRVGGREHSAIAGAIIAARTNHIPVVLSGATAFAIVSLLEREKSGSCDHCLFAGYAPTDHNSNPLQLKQWNILPSGGELIDGSASALAITMLKSFAAIHSNSVLGS